jgi:hypothetical protein
MVMAAVMTPAHFDVSAVSDASKEVTRFVLRLTQDKVDRAVLDVPSRRDLGTACD